MTDRALSLSVTERAIIDLQHQREAHMARAMDLVVAWSRTSTPVWRSLLLAFRLPTVG